LALGFCLCLVWGACSLAQDVSVQATHGTVEKAGRDSVTIRPRDAEGRFEKVLTLKLTGTSKIATLTTPKRGGRAVLTQRDTDASDLKPKQRITVIYATTRSGPVL